MLREFVEFLYFLFYAVGFMGFGVVWFLLWVMQVMVLFFWVGLIWIAALILLGVLASHLEKRLYRSS